MHQVFVRRTCCYKTWIYVVFPNWFIRNKDMHWPISKYGFLSVLLHFCDWIMNISIAYTIDKDSTRSCNDIVLCLESDSIVVSFLQGTVFFEKRCPSVLVEQRCTYHLRFLIFHHALLYSSTTYKPEFTSKRIWFVT